MTLQEAKDRIAKKYGYPAWGNILYDLFENNITPKHMDDYENEAAELYARSKWDEACLEQRDRCVAQFINSPDVKVNQYSAREYCANAPKPEFR